MIVKNIFHENENLEIHVDERGIIADVFLNDDIDHVNYVKSAPGAIRGNHFHPNTTQHILIVEGELEYWFREKSSLGEGSCYLAKYGDLVTSPPNEIHALRIGDAGCTFLAFSSGPRGGGSYEAETTRTENIIGEQFTL